MPVIRHSLGEHCIEYNGPNYYYYDVCIYEPHRLGTGQGINAIKLIKIILCIYNVPSSVRMALSREHNIDRPLLQRAYNLI